MKEYLLADAALHFSTHVRNSQGKRGDAVGIQILQASSEIAILRDQSIKDQQLANSDQPVYEGTYSSYINEKL